MADRRRSRELGFTLIEVLAALAILVLGLAAGYRILGDGLRGVGRAELRAGALAIAEAQLAALGAERALQTGRVDGAGQGYRWVLSVSRRTDGPFDRVAERGMAAYLVEVTVTDANGAVLRLVTTRLAASS